MLKAKLGGTNEQFVCLIKLKFKWPLVCFWLLITLLLIGMCLLPVGHQNHAITCVAISPNGRWLATGTGQGAVTICDLKLERSCADIDSPTEELNDLEFSPDGRFVVVANSNIQFAALKANVHSFFLRADGRNYGAVRFNKAGAELLTINSQSQIELIDMKSHRTLSTFCCSTFYGEVNYLGSDTRIVSSGHWPRVWTRNGEVIRALTRDRQEETFRPILIDRAAQSIFMGSQDGRVYAWSLNDFQLLGRSPAQSAYINALAIIPGTGELAYYGSSGPLYLWSISRGSSSKVAGIRPTSNLVVLPDHASVLFGTASGKVEIWNFNGHPHRTSSFSVTRRP